MSVDRILRYERMMYFRSEQGEIDSKWAEIIYKNMVTDPEYDHHMYHAYTMGRGAYLDKKTGQPWTPLLRYALRAFSNSASDSLTEKASLKDILHFKVEEILPDSHIIQAQKINRYSKAREEFLNNERDTDSLMEIGAKNIFAINRLCTLNHFLLRFRDTCLKKKIGLSID